jgi:aminoglycoside 6-adenylyltransferase
MAEAQRYAPESMRTAESRLMKQLEERFVAWANTRPDIRAAIVIGSRARMERPADEWSDLDIIIFTTSPQYYLSSVDWLENIGTPLLNYLQDTPTGGHRERRALFEGGLDVDFTIVSNSEAKSLLRFLRLRKRIPQLLQLLPKEKSRKTMQEIAEFACIIRRGMRVLVDKDGVAVHLPLLNDGSFSSSPPRPSKSEFLAVLDEFWYFAVLMTKKLRRGELWTASRINNCSMKHLLLQMLEWHARAINNWDYDTWHGGRFIEHWADSRAVNALSNAFAHYNKEDLRNSLWATLDTFRWLAVETAHRLDFPYPTVTDERVKGLLDQYLSEGTETPSNGGA